MTARSCTRSSGTSRPCSSCASTAVGRVRLLLNTIDAPRSEAELDELLSAPTPETVEAVSRLEGDLLLLGAGGKMGSSLARLAKRSIDAAGLGHRVICVSRFGSGDVAAKLRDDDIETISADLLDREQLAALPDAPNVVYLAGFKFGASAAPHRTWAMNALLPALVAERFSAARVVALSTGNVYPQVPVGRRRSHGADAAGAGGRVRAVVPRTRAHVRVHGGDARHAIGADPPQLRDRPALRRAGRRRRKGLPRRAGRRGDGVDQHDLAGRRERRAPARVRPRRCAARHPERHRA